MDRQLIIAAKVWDDQSSAINKEKLLWNKRLKRVDLPAFHKKL